MQQHFARDACVSCLAASWCACGGWFCILQTCGARLKLQENVENGGHNDTWEVGGHSYYNKLREFVHAALAESTALTDVRGFSKAYSTISDASTTMSLRQMQKSNSVTDQQDL